MSLCGTGIAALANTIYQGLGSPRSQSIGFVSGWLVNNVNLGDLNNKVNTSFYVDGDNCIKDDFGAEEANIYSLMYAAGYYEGAARDALAGCGVLWTSITEGDTKITRSDMVAVSKQLFEIKKNTELNLNLAIANYIRRIAVPQTVDAASSASYPTP